MCLLFITFVPHMRRKTFIVLLFLVVVYVMASTNMPLFKSSRKKPIADFLATNDSLKRDSLGANAVDTTKMDSLQLAIYRYNKQIDDGSNEWSDGYERME